MNGNFRGNFTYIVQGCTNKYISIHYEVIIHIVYS